MTAPQPSITLNWEFEEADCVSCVETVCQGNGVMISESGTDSVICGSCVFRLFEDAQRAEHSWPPKWGPTRLEAKVFESILGKEFVKRYQKREQEYSTPIKDRTYCANKKCGAFISRGSHRAGVQTKLRCTSCGYAVCSTCKAAVSDAPSGLRNHECRDPQDSSHEIEAAGLRRGVNFQTCPNCARHIERSEGCNELQCTCGTSFCFICCCKMASRGTNHFIQATGGCPRFGRPGPRAIYDQARPAANTQIEHMANELVREIVRHGIEEHGLNNAEEWIRERIEAFRVAHVPDSPEPRWNTIAAGIRDRLTNLEAVAREVGFFWLDDGLAEPPTTHAQMAFFYVLINIDLSEFYTMRHGRDWHLPIGFGFRHWEAVNALARQMLAMEEADWQQSYPRLRAMFTNYLADLPVGIRQLLEPQAAEREISAFVSARHADVNLAEAEDGPHDPEQISQTHRDLAEARDIREAVRVIREQQRAFPAVSFGRNWVPMDDHTQNFVERQSTLTPVFRGFHDRGLRNLLPATYVLWREYTESLTRPLRDHFLERFGAWRL